MATKTHLFEDLATALESWTAAGAKALTDQRADLVWVEAEEPYREIRDALAAAGVSQDAVSQAVFECLRGFAVSLLTALDGGTALAEKGARLAMGWVTISTMTLSATSSKLGV